MELLEISEINTIFGTVCPTEKILYDLEREKYSKNFLFYKKICLQCPKPTSFTFLRHRNFFKVPFRF